MGNKIYQKFVLNFQSSIQTPKLGPLKLSASMNSCRDSALKKLNIDPLVIDLTGRGIELSSYRENNVLFDIDGDGFLEETGWTGPESGILVVDRNKNGVIDSIEEIISEKFDGISAEDGFAALRRYDLNKDGIIDDKDPIFADLRVWINKGSDGVTQPGELIKLSELGIVAIAVGEKDVSRWQRKA